MSKPDIKQVKRGIEDLAIPYFPSRGLRYLITGLPRIRSAWLAALLSSDQLPCYHDAISLDTDIQYADFGMSDPCAACTYPNIALNAIDRHCKVVVITRNPLDSRQSFDRFMPGGISQYGWCSILERYEYFTSTLLKTHSTDNYRTVKFFDLEDYKTVNSLSVFCTGKPISLQRFQLFDRLRVEQHLPKALLHSKEQGAA